MRGMTWDHPRGYDPLVAAATTWAGLTGTAIAWDKRSLQDFETYPVEQLARAYDLIVIDHPHVGIVAAEGALLPFAGGLDEIAAGSIGGSPASYHLDGRQWALPIDAAAQVQAWVPGRIGAPLSGWEEVIDRARAGQIALPLRPPHSLMSLMTLCGLSGVPLEAAGAALFSPEAALAAERLQQLARLVPPEAVRQDPIAVLDAMAAPDSPIVAAPLIYGYVSYARAGFRPTRLAFADLPVLGAAGPAGSVLGGTGIAVSAHAADPEGATAFARWLASGDVQRLIVAARGGQPAHAAAWNDAAVNAAAGDFYRATRATLDRAWVRPRHAGYMAFQQAASDRLNHALRVGEDAAALITALNAFYARSRSPGEAA